MTAVGFEDVRVQTMPGWQQHVVHTLLGRSPGVPAGPDPDAPTPLAGLDLRK